MRLARVVPQRCRAGGIQRGSAAASDATDLLYIGELRPIKGVDVLLDAIADLRQRGSKLTATIVGDGPVARGVCIGMPTQPDSKDVVHFRAPMPAREAFRARPHRWWFRRARNRLPYIVLEIAAAGKPLIATNVGGIPDMFGPLAERLIPPDDATRSDDAICDRR